MHGWFHHWRGKAPHQEHRNAQIQRPRQPDPLWQLPCLCVVTSTATDHATMLSWPSLVSFPPDSLLPCSKEPQAAATVLSPNCRKNPFNQKVVWFPSCLTVLMVQIQTLALK